MLYLLLLYALYHLIRRHRQEQTQAVVQCSYNYALVEQDQKRAQREARERQDRANKALQAEIKRQAARKQIESIDLLQEELFAYMQALHKEEKALRLELPTANDKRAAQIRSKLTTIASKRASLSGRIAANQCRIERLSTV